MTLSNHERIGRALESARAGLLMYVTDEMERVYGTSWRQRARESLPGWQKTMGAELVLDIQALIAIALDPRHECLVLLKTLAHEPSSSTCARFATPSHITRRLGSSTLVVLSAL